MVQKAYFNFQFQEKFPSPFLEGNDIQYLAEHLGSRCPAHSSNVFSEYLFRPCLYEIDTKI